ncbi:hypothetical protein ACGFNX_37895 [Streptomyces sp. NPDC048723]|uniref:hypothetical protein n=1 Tax=Streptomyces sp. NPDC048723 TaxID=3365589 RepID=UPI00371279E5
MPAVPAAGALGDARAVFGHFLERTGLLRAPTEDTVPFVHRTFQDFLGARAALDEGSLGELTGHADDDQWEGVLELLPPPERAPAGPAALHTVQAAGGVPSELAVPFLVGYTGHPSYAPPVRSAVLDLRDALLPIGPVLAGWTSLRGLVLRGTHANWSLDGFAPRVELYRVNIHSVTPDAAGPVDLSRHRGLRPVSLGECRAPRDPAEWQELALLTKLTELAVPDQSLALVPDGLRMPSVEQLHVPRSTGLGARKSPAGCPRSSPA